MGTSHDVRQILPNYKSLSADNFISVISSVSATEAGNSIVKNVSMTVKPQYNPTTGIVSAPNSATSAGGAVSVSVSGKIYYVEL